MSEVIKPQDTLKERATELFGLCDQDRKGFITRNDLVQVITKLGLPLEPKQVEQAFTKLDNDQNGYLTLEEFIEGFGLFLGIDINDLNDNTTELEEIATSDPGRELFYLCDKDRKGYITKADLQRVSYDLNLNSDQLDLIFDKLDQDGNGRLTLDEFAQGFGAFLHGATPSEEIDEVIKDDGIEVKAFDQPRDVFQSATTEDSSSNTKEDAVFSEVVESIGEETLSGALSKEQLRELWESLQHNDSRAIHKFEDFLAKVSIEIKKAKTDSEQLENALRSKINAHDREVQKLYEEMEQQIKTVKERYETEHEKREKAIKGELMSELERKEMEIQWMLNKQKKLEDRIAQNEKLQLEIRSENELLLQKNTSLEDQLNDSVMSLEDTRNYVQHLQTITAEEKEERARHAIKLTEGMQLEQESLIQQLDLLRDVNQKLRDDRDSIEAAHKAMLMTKHKKVNRQGSKMSKYVGGSRSPTSPDLVRQRSFGSIEEERNHSNRGSTDSLHGGFPMGLSINQEVEFEGDVELGKIADEKPSTPAWANNILTAFQKVEDEKKKIGEEEIEDFRERKAKLLSSVQEQSSEDEREVFSSGESSGSDSRPRSPRTAPIGRDDESLHAESASMVSLEPAKSTTPVRVFKVVIVGDSGVGKSSFLHRFCHDQWKPSFTATIGVDFQIKTMTVNGRCVAIQLWDTAGQERFRSITKQYFRKADGILIFYDVTAETSYLNLKSWMSSVGESAEEKAALMIVGNKVDLAEDSKSRVVKTQVAESFAKFYNALYMETSAKSGLNINEAMIRLAEVLQEREDEMMNSVLNLVKLPTAKKKGCCSKS